MSVHAGPTRDSTSSPAPWNPERIRELLEEAGEIACRHRKDMRRELKADRSIVTQADRDIEALFAREFDRPDDGVYLIGEETIEQKGEDYIRQALGGTTYVIDPIDGTSPYAHSLPNWGVSVGRMENGRLVDGAVFLPEFRSGELVLSDGHKVLEGSPSSSGAWSFRELEAPDAGATRGALIAISQDIAKRGRASCENSVQALGAAVVPLVGLLQGRFYAYVGQLKLWDMAGCLPLLDRLGFSILHFSGEQPGPLSMGVDGSHYDMDPDSPRRWRVLGGLFVCPPGEEHRLREKFELGAG